MNTATSHEVPDHGHETIARIGVENCCRGSDDDFAIHERAADVMIALRKKGIPAHLEKHLDASGEHVDVVQDLDEDTAPPGK